METHPEQFDDICPLKSNEVPAAVAQLLSEPQFIKVLAYLFPKQDIEEVKALFQRVQSVDDFQRKIDYPFLKNLEAKTSLGITLKGIDGLDKSLNYLYISNHRDIVLDSAYLCINLIDNNLDTVEIAIGDNLLIYPWIATLVRLNKSFLVKRGVSGRGQLEASQHLSSYIRYALLEKRQSIWLAQREGRAKDGNDRTQESLLKMLNMSGTGTISNNLSELNICPLSISYEYDPCDFLKAKEFQQKRDDAEFKKSPADDLISMQTGMLGYKGHVVYTLGENLSDSLRNLPHLPRNEQYEAIAKLIDKQIHKNFVIFDTNRIANDLLHPQNKVGGYEPEAVVAFEKYIDQQIRKIDLQNRDDAFLRERILDMYANPLVNKLLAQE